MAFKGKLISSGGNAKTVKGDKASQYETAIMYLAPFTSAMPGRNVCPMAETAKCHEGCLNTAGRAALFSAIGEARKRKTLFYLNDRSAFLATLVSDIERFIKYCRKRGKLPAVRLNGTSDIMWERGHTVVRSGWLGTTGVYTSIMAAFPEVQFYDYTKISKRVVDGRLPPNYKLTLSYSLANMDYALDIVTKVRSSKANMAVVFRTKAMVQKLVEQGTWHDMPVIDGDLTDLRFLDEGPGAVVALYAKGKAKYDTSGFVVDV